MDDRSLDAVFHALASSHRRRIVDVLKASPGANVNQVSTVITDIGRIAVLKHLAVLEGASLVISEKVGRERRLWFNPVPIQLIHERWTTDFSAHWAAQLTRLQYAAEGAEVIPISKGKSRD
jgi:DNA-binding transcriptional ArsR family regulator